METRWKEIGHTNGDKPWRQTWRQQWRQMETNWRQNINLYDVKLRRIESKGKQQCRQN